MNKSQLGGWAILASIIIFVLSIFGVIIVNNDDQILISPQQNIVTENSNTQSQTLSIKVVDANQIEKNYSYDFNLQNINNLEEIFNVLDQTSEEFSIAYKEFDFGKMITTVNGYEAKNNEFWNLIHNGESAQVGVSQLQVNPGDTVQLALTTF